MTLYALSSENIQFPDVQLALNDPNGLLAIGGDLSPERLRSAYTLGIFPWYSEGDPILWWSPDPRAILQVDELYINRSLKKFLKKSPYRVTINHAFDKVIRFCARAPYRHDGVWILPEMITAYHSLHEMGIAHSIEVWLQDELVGGLYGVAIGGSFSGESMFHLSPNASKQALVNLVYELRSHDISMIDCQILNPFLATLGCKEVPRDDFLRLKDKDTAITLPENFWQPRELSIIE